MNRRHNTTDDEHKNDAARLRAVLQANPVLTAPDFRSKTALWNRLKTEADLRNLSGIDSVRFIAAGMKAAGAA